MKKPVTKKDAAYFVRVSNLKAVVASSGITHLQLATQVGCSAKAVTELINGVCGSEALLSSVEKAAGNLAGERFVTLLATLNNSMSTVSGMAASFTTSARRVYEEKETVGA